MSALDEKLAPPLINPQISMGDVTADISRLEAQNTALRFKFGSICSRYQAFKRQWNEVLRQIEAGTYAREDAEHFVRAAARALGRITGPGFDEDGTI